MSNTWLTLRNPLPENIAGILRSVPRVTERLSISSFIVGATARDIILEHVYAAGIRRATKDIDFGVAVASWAEYEQLKAALIDTEGFRVDQRVAQRLWRGDGNQALKIDLVPYGGLESPAGTVTFPPTGFAMNTNGLAEACRAAVTVALNDNFMFRVVSLAGLVLLKFIAYHDRPQERQTDLQDIWFVAKNYLAAGQEERLYADAALLSETGFDLRTVGARLLGRDLAGLLTEQTRPLVSAHLTETDETTGLLRTADLINHRERGFADDLAVIVETLRELKRGILEL